MAGETVETVLKMPGGRRSGLGEGKLSPLRGFTVGEGRDHGLEVKSNQVGPVKWWVWNAELKDPKVGTPFLLLLHLVSFSLFPPKGEFSLFLE